jgi:hypothetical protein
LVRVNSFVEKNEMVQIGSVRKCKCCIYQLSKVSLKKQIRRKYLNDGNSIRENTMREDERKDVNPDDLEWQAFRWLNWDEKWEIIIWNEKL